MLVLILWSLAPFGSGSLVFGSDSSGLEAKHRQILKLILKSKADFKITGVDFKISKQILKSKEHILKSMSRFKNIGADFKM